jgi:hypothetical protein
MMALTVLTVLVLQDDGILLRYGNERAKTAVASEMTLELDIKGSDVAVNFIRSTSPFFSFSKIHWVADGERRTDKKSVRTDFAEARVDGVYDDEKYEYDFQRGAPPSDLQTDKLKGLLWMLAMNGHPQTLTPTGDLRAADPNQDAMGEAMMLLAWPVARPSEKPAKAGDTWETKWRGERKDKQSKAQVDYAQKVTLEKLADGVAELVFELTGTGTGQKAAGQDKAEQKVESKGKVRLDTRTGQILGWQSDGKITVTFAGTDPGSGEALEVTVTFAIKSKLEVK